MAAFLKLIITYSQLIVSLSNLISSNMSADYFLHKVLLSVFKKAFVNSINST